MKKLFQLLVAMIFGMTVANAASSQEMRIYTTIHDRTLHDQQPPNAPKTPEQRSLMLFHAGKVYDYIEPAQEVTFFEPAHQRFTILNLRRQLRTELHQEEIRQFLGLAEDEARRRLGTSENDSAPATRKALELLQFQLHPEFTTLFDAAKSQISLTSPGFQYSAIGFAPPSPDIVEKYLYVADWTAQFNSVLHPQTLLPASRLMLNQEFRQQSLVPSSVKLQVDTDPVIHLEARHEWTWSLQKTDRQMIDEWEKQLQSPKLRTVSFRQFQQEMLKSEPTRKR